MLPSSTHESPRFDASGAADLEVFIRAVRSLVDARLIAFFADKLAEAERVSPQSLELVQALEALTMRGGKRLRPVVVAAAMLAVRPDTELTRAGEVAASLELLQTYLLAHDDFMDGDLVRRGGPAVHAVFRTRYGDAHLGDSLGVLAGDLASAYSLELMLSATTEPTTQRALLAALVQLRKEVYFGQHLDMIGDSDVERMRDLKTGSYTVRGPAALGGILAGANTQQLAALRAWADPLGEAFQLADDILGTFGTSGDTGKPGDDLRHGKRTSLVVEAEARLDPEELRGLLALLGDASASDASIHAMVELFRVRGVRSAVEGRAAARLTASRSALATAVTSGELDATAATRLDALGTLLVVRDR